MYDFLTDLDEYFCEKYANYDKLCILPGYKMPVMQATRIDEFGRTYAYTLPTETMRLATQEKKAELLALLKEKITDKTFSFSFRPLGFFGKIKNKCSKFGFPKNMRAILAKYAVSEEQAGEGLAISKEIWTKICKGSFVPTKNLIFSLALTVQTTFEDALALLALCDERMDYALEKDVVVAYLLTRKVFNRDMMDAALKEYKIRNLFIA